MIRLTLCALILSACASFDRYQWWHDASMPVCEDVRWVQVERWRTVGLCTDERGAAAAGTSCVLGCIIVSQYSEAEARTKIIDGITLYDHEVTMHAKGRMRHQHE